MLPIKISQFGIFFSLKFGEFESFLPLENLCIGQNHIFQVEFWWKFTSRRTVGWSPLSHCGTWNWRVRAEYMYTLHWWFSKSKNQFSPLIEGSKKSQNQLWPLIRVPKNYKVLGQKTYLKPLVLYENCQLFKTFQNLEPDGPLILKILKNWNYRFWDFEDFQNTGTRDSLISKCFETGNWMLLRNPGNQTTLVFINVW